MELLLRRDMFTETSTTGKLYVDGSFECYTLEDRVRDKKVYGETAIPSGRYKVIVNKSPRFGVDMPLLLNVPGFKGVRIHTGNWAHNTEGCILVGQGRSKDALSASKAAYKPLFKKLKEAQDAGEDIFIKIVIQVPDHVGKAAATA